VAQLQTSDAWGYRELGAEKSGRDSKGNVWNERWMECMDQQSDTGVSTVQRTCVRSRLSHRPQAPIHPVHSGGRLSAWISRATRACPPSAQSGVWERGESECGFLRYGALIDRDHW
jgi:hypothetical protein